MPVDIQAIQTVHYLQRGGRYYIPPTSDSGYVPRPKLQARDSERTANLQTLWDYFIDNVPNPDEAKRQDPEIETKIRMHPDVTGAMRKRLFTVASMPWRIDPNPDAPDGLKTQAEEVAKYVGNVWKKIPRLRHLYGWLQYSVLVGGQGIEFMWHTGADGVEYPVSFQPVHMSRFLFDRLGNMALLTREQTVWGAYVSSDPQAQYKKILPRGKFLYHIYQQGQGTWEKPHLEGYVYYGVGEDVALYYPITFDIFALRFRMKWLEKYGLPPTVLHYAENRAMTSEILRICDSLRGESIITVPMLMGSAGQDNSNSYYKIDQLPVPSMTNDAFSDFSERWTKPRIDTILLGSAEEGQKTEGKGGYSDHVSRRDSGPNIWFRWDAMNISETITTQILPAIALGRYPNLPPELWPVHVLEPKEEKDRQQEVGIIESASKIIPIAEDYVYEVTGIPKPEEGQKTIGGQAAAQMDDGLGLGNPMGQPMRPQLPGVAGAHREAIGAGTNGGAGAHAGQA